MQSAHSSAVLKQSEAEGAAASTSASAVGSGGGDGDEEKRGGGEERRYAVAEAETQVRVRRQAVRALESMVQQLREQSLLLALQWRWEGALRTRIALYQARSDPNRNPSGCDACLLAADHTLHQPRSDSTRWFRYLGRTLNLLAMQSDCAHLSPPPFPNPRRRGAGALTFHPPPFTRVILLFLCGMPVRSC